MEDKTTPHLKPEGHQAILSGSDFLTSREAHLRARLDNMDAELADLGDVSDNVEDLERQALDALRALSDLLEPPAVPPTTISPPEPMLVSPPAVQQVNHRKPRRATGIVVLLLVIAVSALSLAWIYGPELLGDNSPATAIVQATATHIPMLPTSTTISPTRSPATLTPTPSPTIVAPAIPEPRGQNRGIIQAERVQILDVSGTLRLELPLSVMTNTIQMVEGIPVLHPVLPFSGAGVHRGSVPFGEPGGVIMAISAETAPVSLWQTRPGNGLIGCNSDDACYDYRVTEADTWSIERLRQLLASWSTDVGVLLYTAVDESSAWVIEAQPLNQEETR